MKFTPYASDREIEELNLVRDGKYPGIVIEASEDKKDKNGNDMIKLKVHIFDMNDRTRIINDALLFDFPLKLKHFCDSTGLSENYKRGEVNSRDCIGKKFIASVVVSKPDKDGKKWNRIEDYFSNQSSTENSNNFVDSDLPDLFV